MTKQRVYGRTKTGKPITDEVIDQLAEEAERGYEPGQLSGRRRGPGRPSLGRGTQGVGGGTLASSDKRPK